MTETHTGFWEYLIALALQDQGVHTFTVQEMVSRIRELEQYCLLAKVSETTIIEQLTSRCCAQGSVQFGSLLNYFNREEEGEYSLFNQEIHMPSPERLNESHIPTARVVRHITKHHSAELRCVLNFLGIPASRIL